MSNTTDISWKNKRAPWLLALTCGVVLIGLCGWWRGWLADEPVSNGKTVTQWLDSMKLFDEERNRELTGANRVRFPESPEVVTNDPALRALLRIGSNAVPILVRRMTEPPQWSPTVGPVTRLKMWTAWKWTQLQNPGRAPPRPAPHDRNSFQRARNMAAALALLALGTNAHAGVPRLLEASTAAPGDAIGNRDTSMYPAFRVATLGFPHRREEMISGITSAMCETNAGTRRAAAGLTKTFRNPWPSDWKQRLLRMSEEDADASVRLSAMWSLAVSARGDADVVQLLEAVLKNKSNPALHRARAAGALGFAGSKAKHSLPLLREALNDTDQFLQSEARTAIHNIEKAIGGD